MLISGFLELTSTISIDTSATSKETTEHSSQAKEENKSSFSKCSRHDITHLLVYLDIKDVINACFNTFMEHEGAYLCLFTKITGKKFFKIKNIFVVPFLKHCYQYNINFLPEFT